MRIRMLLTACAFVLAACGGGSGPLGVSGPPSAQTVAASDSDWSGLKKCSESGSYDSYLKEEQTKAPDQYSSEKSTWDDLKKAGADDSYIAAYAENTSDCGQFAANTPTGKVAYVYAIRFKDESSASSNYKAEAKNFHLSDSEVSQLKAAGATVNEGSATGLGNNSIALSIDIEGANLYVAFWQNKRFEVAVLAFNEGSQAAQAATKVNSRIK